MLVSPARIKPQILASRMKKNNYHDITIYQKYSYFTTLTFNTMRYVKGRIEMMRSGAVTIYVFIKPICPNI